MPILLIIFLSQLSFAQDICQLSPDDFFLKFGEDKHARSLFNDDESAAQIYISFSKIYFNHKNYPEALLCAKNSGFFQNQTKKTLADAFTLRAKAHLHLDEPDQAYELLIKALKLLPETTPTQKIETYFTLADYYIAINNYDEALKQLKSGLSAFPEKMDETTRFNYELWSGWILYNCHEYEKALNVFENTKKTTRIGVFKKYQAYLGIFKTLNTLKRYKETLLQIKEAKKTQSMLSTTKQIELDLIEADTFQILEDYPKSVKIYEKTLSHPEINDSQKFRANIGIIKALNFKGELSKSFAVIEQVKKQQNKLKLSELVELYSIEAETLELNRDFEKAATCFQKIVQTPNVSDKEKVKFYLKIVDNYKAIKKYDAAEEYYKKALASSPSDSPEHKNINRDFNIFYLNKLLQNPSEEILQIFKKIQDITYKNEEFLLTGISIRAFKTIYNFYDNKIEKEINQTLSVSKTDTSRRIFSHFFWGNYFLHNKMYEKSEIEFTKLLDFEKGKILGYAGLENVATAKEQIAVALQHYIVSRRLSGTKWYAYQQRPLGQLFQLSLKTIEPKNFSGLVSQLSMSMPEYKNVLYSLLSEAYLQKNMLNEAEKAAQESIKSENKDSYHREWARAILADIYFFRKNYGKAEKQYKKALEIDAGSYDVVKRASVFFAETQQIANAEEIYQQLITKNSYLANIDFENTKEYPEDYIAELTLELGRLCLRTGCKNRPETYFNNVLMMNCNKNYKEQAESSLKMILNSQN